MDYLNNEKIILKKEENKLISLTYEDKTYFAIKVIRCFPLTNPDSYISLQYEENDENKEIGLIESLNKLSLENQKIIKEDLELRYFMPEIININKKQYKKGFYTFKVETSSGNKDIRIKDLVYNLFPTKDGNLLIRDVDENYYIIRKYQESKNHYVKFLISFI